MRSNKCPYCTFDKYGDGKTWIDSNDHESDLYKKDKYIWIENHQGSATANIKYCPMCGRELTKEV